MSDALAPGTRLGPYQIEGLIGAGGMGQVYRAKDPRLGRHVAVKPLSGLAAADPDRARRFESEAKAAGTLDHPDLLVVYDTGCEGAVPERQAIEYAVHIVRGLQRHTSAASSIGT